MKRKVAVAAPLDQWTLIRGIRQLLTLRGSAGPRRGLALAELHPILDGALLIRNGVIQEAGPASRVENLVSARNARELNAGRRIVMPAFADPDGVLVFEAAARSRMDAGATAIVAEMVRAGILSVGAHTGYTKNLHDALKTLRVHRRLQNKPVRIRSMVCPDVSSESGIREMNEEWLPLIRKRKLASIVEFTCGGGEGALDAAQGRVAGTMAAERGFLIRIRFSGAIEPALLGLAAEAGAVALIGFPVAMHSVVADSEALYVLPAGEALAGTCGRAPQIRQAIDRGVAVAIGSGYRKSGLRSLNPQYLIYAAMEQFGLSCEEAILASTYNAACSLLMSHRTGSLEPGKAADLVIVDVPDYRDLPCRVGHNDVAVTMRAGAVVYRRGAVGSVRETAG